MSLPFARLALPGETPNAWPEPSLAELSRYFHAKIRHRAAMDAAKVVRRPRDYSQTKKAIYCRAKRAGTFVPKTKDQISASHSAIASARAVRGWQTRKNKP